MVSGVVQNGCGRVKNRVPNYTSATFLVVSERGGGVLKASWTGLSSFFKRSGLTNLPN